MKKIIFFLVLVTVMSCKQDKHPLLGETEFQREMNADFKDASKSPLKDKDRKHFKGLDFFAFDSTFVVVATLIRSPDSNWFDMKTTTSRVSKERVFGAVTFKINDKTYQLKVYQGMDKMKTVGFENYLFLPFIDNTNGNESYGGGRYIDLRIPVGDTIIIDFNKAYNPYCVYDEKYSCPLVPRENYLALEVKAGLKAFEKQ